MKIGKKYIILAVVVLIITGGSYYWYKKTHPSAQSVQYATAAAEKGTLTTSITGSGNVIVDQQANIDPTISGTVANLSVGIGDSVKKRQFLFSIKNDDLDVNLVKAKASYLSAKKSNDSEATHTKITQINFEAAKVDYENKKADAAKRTVTAPISGTVNAVNIKNGDDLSRLSSSSNSSAPIIIGDLSTLKAQVEVNEVDVPNVSIGQKATMTFNAINDLTLTGKVEKIDSLGTSTSGVVTYNVTIGFDSIDARIRPEMSVSVDIITGVKQDILIIPNSAVKLQNGKNFVQILKDGQTVPRQVAVEVGISSNTNTEIVSGLNAGDKIVTQTINSSAATSTSTSDNKLRVPGL